MPISVRPTSYRHPELVAQTINSEMPNQVINRPHNPMFSTARKNLFPPRLLDRRKLTFPGLAFDFDMLATSPDHNNIAMTSLTALGPEFATITPGPLDARRRVFPREMARNL